jgi:hypothetical protein
MLTEMIKSLPCLSLQFSSPFWQKYRRTSGYLMKMFVDPDFEFVELDTTFRGQRDCHFNSF